MAQIKSIGAGIYTTLAYASDVTVPAGGLSSTTAPSDGTFADIEHVREFPSFGTPANIVNVPAYGQAQSSQIGGQADAPTLEFTLNYVPEDHAGSATDIQNLVGNGTVYVFRIRLANSDLPSSLASTTEHSDFYIQGKIEAFTVSPNLTDSNQATLTLSTQGDYVGPFTTTS